MPDPQPTEINVRYPDAKDLHLRIQVGACRLTVRPGDGEAWVTGTYADPTEVLPARVLEEGGTVTITQSRNELWGRFDGPPRFDLALGRARAYAVTIESGASESRFDFGGLPITRLTLKQGAGKYDIDFSAPNPQAMRMLEIGAGAVALTVGNLANANAPEIRVDGGAAGYKLDFGGALQVDTHARISTGLSGVEITVPESTPVRISVEAVLGGVDVGDGLMKKEGAYWNQAALAGGAPLLTIHATVALGGLKLRLT